MKKNLKYMFNFMLLFMACNSNAKKQISKIDTNQSSPTHKIVTSRDTLNDNSKSKKAFFESILSKSSLPVEQVKNYTNLIDSGYFTSNSSFSGDTIYYANSNNQIVVLRYSDGLVCAKWLLFVYKINVLKSTDYQLIKTDCDEDDSADFDKLDYQIISDSVFYTKETFIERKKGHKDNKTVTTQVYEINNKGRLIRAK